MKKNSVVCCRCSQSGLPWQTGPESGRPVGRFMPRHQPEQPERNLLQHADVAFERREEHRCRRVVELHQRNLRARIRSGCRLPRTIRTWSTRDGFVLQDNERRASWSSLPGPGGCYFQDIEVNPHNSQEVFGTGYTTSSPHAVVARTTNGGTSWSLLTCDTVTSSYGYRVRVDPTDTSVIYCAGFGAGRTASYIVRPTTAITGRQLTWAWPGRARTASTFARSILKSSSSACTRPACT